MYEIHNCLPVLGCYIENSQALYEENCAYQIVAGAQSFLLGTSSYPNGCPKEILKALCWSKSWKITIVARATSQDYLSQPKL